MASLGVTPPIPSKIYWSLGLAHKESCIDTGNLRRKSFYLQNDTLQLFCRRRNAIQTESSVSLVCIGRATSRGENPVTSKTKMIFGKDVEDLQH